MAAAQGKLFKKGQIPSDEKHISSSLAQTNENNTRIKFQIIIFFLELIGIYHLSPDSHRYLNPLLYLTIMS